MGRSRSTPGLTDSKSQLNIGNNNNETAKEGDKTRDAQEGKTEAAGRPVLSSSSTATSSNINIDNRNVSSQEQLPGKTHSYPPPLYSSLPQHQMYLPTQTTATMMSTTSLTTSSSIHPDSVTINMPSSSPLHGRRTSSPLIPLENPSSLGISSSLPCPRTPVPGEVSQEVLIQEIKNLRHRLYSMETENVSMTLKLSQQQNLVESRLKEIETQFASQSSRGSSTVNLMPDTKTSSGASSSTVLFSPRVTGQGDSHSRDDDESEEVRRSVSSGSQESQEASSVASTPTSGDDSERNKESII